MGKAGSIKQKGVAFCSATLPIFEIANYLHSPQNE